LFSAPDESSAAASNFSPALTRLANSSAFALGHLGGLFALEIGNEAVADLFERTLVRWLNRLHGQNDIAAISSNRGFSSAIRKRKIAFLGFLRIASSNKGSVALMAAFRPRSGDIVRQIVQGDLCWTGDCADSWSAVSLPAYPLARARAACAAIPSLHRTAWCERSLFPLLIM